MAERIHKGERGRAFADLISKTAFSTDLKEQLEQNGVDKTKEWLATNQQRLNHYKSALESCYKRLPQNGDLSKNENEIVSVKVLVPVIPTVLGAFTGHHLTYSMVRKILEVLMREHGERIMIQVEGIFLDHSDSRRMGAAIDREGTDALNQFQQAQYSSGRDAMLDQQLENPAYKAIHKIKFERLIKPTNSLTNETTSYVEYSTEFESDLYRSYIHDTRQFEILRQMTSILHHRKAVHKYRASSHPLGQDFDIGIATSNGIDLQDETLCTVVLRAINHLRNRKAVSILACGGNLFNNLHHIVNDFEGNFGQYFKIQNGGDWLQRLCLLPSVNSEAIRISSIAKPKEPTSVSSSKWDEHREIYTFEALVEAGIQKTQGLEASPNKDTVRQLVDELRVLLGPQEVNVSPKEVLKKAHPIRDTLENNNFLGALTINSWRIIQYLKEADGEEAMDGGMTISDLAEKIEADKDVMMSLRTIGNSLATLIDYKIVQETKQSGRQPAKYKLIADSLVIDFKGLVGSRRSTN